MSRSALTQTIVVDQPKRPVSRVRSILRDLALIPVIILVFIYGFAFVPNFGTVNNIVSNILSVSAVLGVAVVAQSIVLIGGYFDLSAQSTIGLAPMLMVWLYTTNGGVGFITNPWLAILSALVVGAIIGFVNGLLVGRLGMNAFIVTLAMLILLQGFTLGISGGKTFTDLPGPVAELGFANIAGIPVDVVILVLVVAIAAVFMRFTPTGRRIYAMGGNKEAARAAGINTLRLTIGLFVFSGVAAAFAGLMLSARIAAVTSSQGNNIIFTVFAAAVIGGISLDGGKGTIIGAATGVLLLGTIQNILVLSAVPSFWIDATYGAIILGALLIGSTQVRGVVAKLFDRGRSKTA
jgi:Ribose/xylose/arabinose/galactoside ABC-type transport systems, permease components